MGHSFHTRTILDTGFSGWTTVETVLIRLNDSFTPSGRFPVYSNVSIPDARGVKTKVGYDAAVCVEKYDPWIIEAYNSSTGAPVILRIVGTSDPDASKPSGNIQGIPLGRTRFLNSTGKNPAFFVAHDNSINQMVKDNGRDYPYVPSPIVSPCPRRMLFFFRTGGNLSCRVFPSLMALDPRVIRNCHQIVLLSFAPGLMRLMFFHSSWGLVPLSHNRTRMTRSRMSLMLGGSWYASRCLCYFWESQENCSFLRCQ